MLGAVKAAAVGSSGRRSISHHSCPTAVDVSAPASLGRAGMEIPPWLTPPGRLFFLYSPTFLGSTRSMGWKPSSPVAWSGTMPSPGPTRTCGAGSTLFCRPDTQVRSCAAAVSAAVCPTLPPNVTGTDADSLGLTRVSASRLLR